MSDKVLNIEISGTNFKLTDQEQSYVEKRCHKLVNHMPTHSRKSAFASAKITKMNQKSGDKYQCDIVLTLPDKTLVAGEIAPSLTEAIDETERKLQDQIRRYKTERRNDGVNRGGFVAKIKRSLRRQ